MKILPVGGRVVPLGSIEDRTNMTKISADFAESDPKCKKGAQKAFVTEFEGICAGVERGNYKNVLLKI